MNWIPFVITAAAFIILFLWSITAYQITSWRGWTPDYDATVVVPGDYMDGDDDLLITASYYLRSHEDTVCVVGSETDKDQLAAQGIDEERILVQESSDIDSMLVSAQTLIKENHLPSRLTVCAYSIQQERIGRHAKALHIPVNSLSVKPKSDYLTLFAAEQWRLLWGE